MLRAQVTWGHPCCFERSRRKPGAVDANRAFFRATVDICRDNWLILHKIEYTEELIYLGRRLRQCGRVAALRDRSRALAARSQESAPPSPPEHGKVHPPGPGYRAQVLGPDKMEMTHPRLCVFWVSMQRLPLDGLFTERFILKPSSPNFGFHLGSRFCKR